MPLNVPLTGSMVPGPLGLAHLPRMWQKGMLTSIGVLPDDYLFGRGFDRLQPWTLAALEADALTERVGHDENV